MAQAPSLQAHPVADLFPLMSEAEYGDLLADIRTHGLREAVWIHRDGRLIDGRNRHRACTELGLPVAQRTYEGADGDLVAFVVSLNLKRRHLNESQRAMVAARIANLPLGANQHAKTEGASIEAPSPLPLEEAPPPRSVGLSQAAAAEQLNVGRASVQRARAVIEHGVPELVEKVNRGEIAVSTAAVIADAPEDIQRKAIVEHDRKAIGEAAKEIKQARQLVARTAAADHDPVQDFLDADADINRERFQYRIQAAVKAAAALTMLPVDATAAAMDEELWDSLAVTVEEINNWAGKLDAASGRKNGRLAGPPQLKVIGGNR